jgi:predicted DCC family thiol-disulfide oxidoreductase YuxK
VDSDREIVVIYDGLCQFCEQSLIWLQRKLVVQAVAFQTADLQLFNLTREQCATQLYVITSTDTYAGADAIRHLLQHRGNKTAAFLLGVSGNLGRTGYRWVATHRNTWPIKIATRVLYFLNK